MQQENKSEQYAQLLKDPRWQKKRCEILTRDHFTCRHCGATDKSLHVHHLYYLPSAHPWEYKDEALVTLCVDCHKEVHRIMDMKKEYDEVTKDITVEKVMSSSIRDLNMYMSQSELIHKKYEEIRKMDKVKKIDLVAFTFYNDCQLVESDIIRICEKWRIEEYPEIQNKLKELYAGVIDVRNICREKNLDKRDEFKSSMWLNSDWIKSSVLSPDAERNHLLRDKGICEQNIKNYKDLMANCFDLHGNKLDYTEKIKKCESKLLEIERKLIQLNK